MPHVDDYYRVGWDSPDLFEDTVMSELLEEEDESQGFTGVSTQRGEASVPAAIGSLIVLSALALGAIWLAGLAARAAVIVFEHGWNVIS